MPIEPDDYALVLGINHYSSAELATIRRRNWCRWRARYATREKWNSGS